jgi:hypothetical protein
MIPNQFHFVFGLKEDFGGKPFNILHYLAIKSAYDLNKPDAMYFYYMYEPSGEYWDKSKPYLTLVQVESPTEIFGNPLTHVAHKADIIRLQALYENGGIYMDLDTICVKSFEPLLKEKTVLGIQGHRTSPTTAYGLCNAIILAEKESEFIGYWLSQYTDFNSAYWDSHSVQLPLYLSQTTDLPITTLPYNAFHYPLYTPEGVDDLFKHNKEYPEAYAHHLWESNSWSYIQLLTEDYIKTTDTTYNKIARQFI